MILFDECTLMSLCDFGIEIPILDDRALRTIEALQEKHPRVETWRLPFQGTSISKDDLLAVHDRRYVERLYSDDLAEELLKAFELIRDGRMHRYDPRYACKPLADLFPPLLKIVAGTYDCARYALDRGFCYFLGGGHHHAMPDCGSGFCLLNDMVIAAHKLRREGRAHKFWFVDVDAHKGDGTAVFCKNDANAATLSIHMGASWPLDDDPFLGDGTLKPSFEPSTLDIPMFPGDEENYNKRLKAGLAILEEKFVPDLVFVIDGADPYEHDELPSTSDLKLTREQLLERDLLLLDFFESRKIPSAWLMAGGYGKRVWEVYYQFLDRVIERASAR